MARVRRVTVLLGLLVAILAASALATPPAQASALASASCPAVERSTSIPTPGDEDDDCVPAERDNCDAVANASQADADQDGVGDACEEDDDNDTVVDSIDNCPTVANPGQEPDETYPQFGAACADDRDGDLVIDAVDNCPFDANDQVDADGDKVGDACDADDDQDGALDKADNCPQNSNKDQADADSDRIGDACDAETFTGPRFVEQPRTPAPPTPAAADRTPARLTLRLASTVRRTDASGGLPAMTRCSEACALSGELTVSGAVARRLKLSRSGRPMILARGTAALEGAGTTYVFLDFGRAAMRRAFASRPVRATLTLRARDAAGNASSVKRGVTLRR
jgi:hypothetical protein